MRGNIGDLFVILIVMLTLVVTCVLVYKILYEFKTKSAGVLPGEMFDYGLRAVRNFNYYYFYILVGFGLATVISAYFIQSHPALFIFNLIIFASFFVFGAIFINAIHERVLKSPGLVDIYNLFPDIQIVNDNIMTIMLFIGVAIMIVLHMKKSYEVSS